MTKHDDMRQALHDTGFRFEGSERTALDMTDEEVEKFVLEFMTRLTPVMRDFANSMRTLLAALVSATEPLRNLGELLVEAGTEDETDGEER